MPQPESRAFLQTPGRARRWRLGIRTGLGAVAIAALMLVGLDSWFVRPYRDEQKSAAALTRLGAKILMVDTASGWLRSYVSQETFDMRVAASVDLSRSKIQDDDLVHLLGFHHAGEVRLAETAITDRGLDRFPTIGRDRWLDLSQTRVTSVAPLFTRSSSNHPISIDLTGNHLARGPILAPERMWSPLQMLNLSQTDADDQTLAAFPAGLVNLYSLNLRGTRVTDAGLNALTRLEALKTVDLVGTQVTAAGITNLTSHWKGQSPLTVIAKPAPPPAPVR